jgi:hypothetical protein
MQQDHYATAPTPVDPLVCAKLASPHHYRRRVKPLLDGACWRDRVKDGSSPGMGRTAEAPGRVIKREVRPLHDRLSERDILAAAPVQVAFRCLLEVSLASRWPVPSVWSQCRTRLGEPRPQARWDEVVAPAHTHGLVDARRS